LYHSHSSTFIRVFQGPFKAIICHDCENSGGVNVGHSVSFSAIKSWNVGSSNVAQKSSFNESLAKQNRQDFNMSGAVEHTSEKYFDAVNSNNDDNKESDINQNAPLVIGENQGSVYNAESSITVNDKQQQQQPALNKDWNYSLLTVRNENIKVNNPIAASSSTTTESSPVAQRKPIFNDLLKVPYDVLNQPLTEAPPPLLSQPPSQSPPSPPPTSPEAIKQTQIHINHQQKFNDTITNYQHFQQFIQKSPSATGHYQSTPMPEQNYEVDESVSLMTNGRAHGVQSTTPKVNSHVSGGGGGSGSEEKNENHHHGISSQQQQPSPSPLHVTHHDQDAKFGVVFEGRDFRKYKVEEKTADGFIVGYVAHYNLYRTHFLFLLPMFMHVLNCNLSLLIAPLITYLFPSSSLHIAASTAISATPMEVRSLAFATPPIQISIHN
jgi:hypothetical protein